MEHTQNLGLLIIHSEYTNTSWCRNLANTEWIVLSFLTDDQESNFVDYCKTQGVVIQGVIKAVKLIDSMSLIARKKYMSFIADWPNRFSVKGKTFKQAFIYDKRVSFWWLCNASFKDNEASNSFLHLSHFEMIREMLKTHSPSKCILITNQPNISNLAKQFCSNMDIPITIIGKELRPSQLNCGFLWGLASRLKHLLSISLELLIGRLIFINPPIRDNIGATGFFTTFPDTLVLTDGKPTDINYMDLPNLMYPVVSKGPLFICTKTCRNLRQWYNLWENRKNICQGNQPQVLFLSNFLNLTDIAIAFKNCFFAIRFLWIDWTNRDYKKTFHYDDVNIYNLVGNDFKKCFLGSQLPSYIILSRLVTRATKQYNLAKVISYLELYPAARALYYGAKRSNHDVTTIAYQHANINRMKLWYSYLPKELIPEQNTNTYSFIETMPIPDFYILQGTLAQNILVESGYPADQCILTGSPRYQLLAQRMLEKRGTDPSTHIPSERPAILVLPSLSEQDAHELIRITVEASKDQRVAIRVRSHPHMSSDDIVLSIKTKYPELDLLSVYGNLYDLIQACTLVVTSYSTAGDESIALGKPVICYSGNKPCMATFLEIPAAPIVRSVDELRSALYNMTHSPLYLTNFKAKWPQLIEGSFFRLDGQAANRIISHLQLNIIPAKTEA